MFGLMTVAAHKKALAIATTADAHRHQIDREIDQRALDAQRSITASLRAEIEAMMPIYNLGLQRQAQREKDAAIKRAKRAQVTAERATPAPKRKVKAS